MDKDEIISQFERAKNMRIYLIFAMSTIPIVQFIILFNFINIFFNFFLSTIAILIILRIYNKNWICPSCKKSLPDRDVSKIEHCPRCGIRLIK